MRSLQEWQVVGIETTGDCYSEGVPRSLTAMFEEDGLPGTQFLLYETVAWSLQHLCGNCPLELQSHKFLLMFDNGCKLVFWLYKTIIEMRSGKLPTLQNRWEDAICRQL